MSTVRIVAGRTGQSVRILLDGQQVNDCAQAVLTMSARGLTTLVLTLIPESVDVEADAVVQIHHPLGPPK